MTRSGTSVLRQRGFTLIEAIITIVITGILAGIVSVFMVAPVTAYLDSTRRADMTSTADGALRRMAYDVRLAVPNSVRVTTSGGARFLEFMPTRDGGRYRVNRVEGTACNAGSNPGNNPLDDLADCDPADNDGFDVLGPPVSGSAGDFVVIGNFTATDTGAGALNAYLGTNRRALAAAAVSAVAYTGAQLPNESPFQRFQIVPSSGPVSYVCTTGSSGAVGSQTGTGTLRRYTGYVSGSNWSVQPTSFTVSGALLAEHVSDCNFSQSNITETNGLVILRITLLRDGESVTLQYAIHVDNTP